MAPIKILVVCEGPTDFPIIEGIINYTGLSNGKSFVVEMISPQIDATTGHPEAHGWPGVKNWCKLYALKSERMVADLDESIRKAVLRRNWESLLLFSGAHSLLVQLDTDIAEQIDSPFDSNNETRRTCCEKHLNTWLGISTAKPNCKYVLPTYAIETWILATYDATNAPHLFPTTPLDYEIIHDYESKLISLGYPSRLVNSKRRLRKSPAQYKNNDKYLPRLISNISNASLRCKELADFISIVESMA